MEANTLLEALALHDDTFFTAGLITMTIFYFIGMLVLFILGSLIAMVLLFVFMAMVLAGIISASFMYGVYKKSFQKGFKLLVVSSLATLGAISSTVITVLLNKIFHWFSFEQALGMGVSIGLVSGILIGFAIIRAIKTLLGNFLKTKTKLELYKF